MDALLVTDLSKLCEEIDNVTMSEHNSVTFTLTIKKNNNCEVRFRVDFSDLSLLR